VGLFGSIGGFFTDLFSGKPKKPTEPSGGDGISTYGGVLPDGETHRDLAGGRKWTTYANAVNTAIVATGVRYFGNLLAGTEWHAEPNPAGGKDAERAAQIVTDGLLQAQMSRPWSAIVRKAAMYRFYGFSLHEWIVRRRDSDGLWVFADIAHRPQDSIDRWDKPDEQTSWRAVSQLTRGGNRYVIPRNRLFYCFDDTLTDSPDGSGLLRHVVELVRRLNVLEGLEGFGFETDLRGMPMGRAPIAELRAQAGTEDEAQIRAYVDRKTKNIRDKLENIIKSPEKLQWLLLDSSTYKGADQTVTAVQKWAFELLKGDATGLADVNVVIGRLQFEIARVFGIDFALVGADGGSYALHEDKTSMFATTLQATLSEISAFATNDLARVLVAFNGLDPETCTPRLVAEPISTDAIEVVTRALMNLSSAGLRADDPARNVIRKRLRLPPEPEPTPGMLGAIPRIPTPPPVGGPPNPDDGEVEVPLDDLGSTEGDRKAA